MTRAFRPWNAAALGFESSSSITMSALEAMAVDPIPPSQQIDNDKIESSETLKTPLPLMNMDKTSNEEKEPKLTNTEETVEMTKENPNNQNENHNQNQKLDKDNERGRKEDNYIKKPGKISSIKPAISKKSNNSKPKVQEQEQEQEKNQNNREISDNPKVASKGIDENGPSPISEMEKKSTPKPISNPSSQSPSPIGNEKLHSPTSSQTHLLQLKKLRLQKELELLDIEEQLAKASN